MSCKQCCGIEEQFNDAVTRKKLRQYRRRGPDKTTRMLIEDLFRALDAEDVHDGVLLDVGAGIGAVHHALIDGRVSRAVHVDASPAQMAAARDETQRRGHANMVEFIDGDFVGLAERLAQADVVTLDRVICCYDDMTRLVRLSAEKARRFYGAVFPRKRAMVRGVLAMINFVQRLKGSSFRVFLHDPAAIDGTLVASGLSRRSARHTIAWEVVVYQRRESPL